jgi:hypothetical protein
VYDLEFERGWWAAGCGLRPAAAPRPAGHRTRLTEQSGQLPHELQLGNSTHPSVNRLATCVPLNLAALGVPTSRAHMHGACRSLPCTHRTAQASPPPAVLQTQRSAPAHRGRRRQGCKQCGCARPGGRAWPTSRAPYAGGCTAQNVPGTRASGSLSCPVAHVHTQSPDISVSILPSRHAWQGQEGSTAPHSWPALSRAAWVTRLLATAQWVIQQAVAKCKVLQYTMPLPAQADEGMKGALCATTANRRCPHCDGRRTQKNVRILTRGWGPGATCGTASGGGGGRSGARRPARAQAQGQAAAV